MPSTAHNRLEALPAALPRTQPADPVRKPIVPIRFQRASTLTLGWNNILQLLSALLDPVVLVLSLWATAVLAEGALTPPYLILSLVVFSLTVPGTSRLKLTGWYLARSIAFDWGIVAALLLFFGYASGYLYVFDPQPVLLWLLFAPTAQFAANVALRRLSPAILELQGEPRRVVIVGVNDAGTMLAHELRDNPYSGSSLLGFFDDRLDDRSPRPRDVPRLGTLGDLPKFIESERIGAIYVSLPMAAQPRILQLLDALGDTTVSIHFVPDIFVTELVQGRLDTIGSIPIVTVCESPFSGTNGIVKRVSDIVFATLILILISPLMLLIAAAVKLSSPGPVIFQQRRYGLNGEEILVSKFRSMTVCEDGGDIRQAQRGDKRITPLGAFLRRTSLDELPQFFDVLQGQMSIVGPRPHAVAHNELYRKVIKGYMIRHKVKPGITGWAQVNGWRGETETLEKMKMRVDYDLAYLRNWSLRLDIYIILKTVFVVLRDRNAY
jgi:putative colanic acid biosynthesis UDP-glucose lipid carrier transferase